MPANDLIKKLKESFQKTLDWFTGEISVIRAARVTIDLIEDIKIDCYGSKLFLKEVASLSLLDSKTISIEPWDKSTIINIEKALQNSEMGGGVRSEEGKVLYSFPDSTSENKEKFVRIVKQKMENAKESLRRARDDTWREIQENERAGEISEDDKFNAKDDFQKLINDFESKIEELEKKKEKEILS